MQPSLETSERRRARRALWVLSALLVAAFVVSFALGRYAVSVKEVLTVLGDSFLSLFGKEPSPVVEANVRTVVMNIRLPRILTACAVGAALSAAGATFQSVFRNPMASPDILGASGGACFGAALAILLNMPKAGVTGFAFVASLASVALVYLIGTAARGNRLLTIILAGIMVNSLFSAGTSYIKLVADPNNQLPAITYWMMGSLSGVRKSDLLFALLPMALGLIPLVLLMWRVNYLTLPEDEARTMGIRTERLRLVTVLSATLLIAASVSVSGMIGWVGLVVPHLSRKLAGNDFRGLLPVSCVFGALFLLITDDISRNLLTTEIPIGILTAFIGAPFFLYLMTRKEDGR
ncbi:MAG: iron ABC transporter permease [Clostridia bacterium]|nr:iron ABC transporter permease [Clostridia bacterium]